MTFMLADFAMSILLALTAFINIINKPKNRLISHRKKCIKTILISLWFDI